MIFILVNMCLAFLGGGGVGVVEDIVHLTNIFYTHDCILHALTCSLLTVTCVTYV